MGSDVPRSWHVYASRFVAALDASHRRSRIKAPESVLPRRLSPSLREGLLVSNLPSGDSLRAGCEPDSLALVSNCRIRHPPGTESFRGAKRIPHLVNAISTMLIESIFLVRHYILIQEDDINSDRIFNYKIFACRKYHSTLLTMILISLSTTHSHACDSNESIILLSRKLFNEQSTPARVAGGS